LYVSPETAAPVGFHSGIDALCQNFMPSKYAPDPANPGAIIYDEEDENTYEYQILLYDGIAMAEDPEYRNKPPTPFDPIAFYTEQAIRERKENPDKPLSTQFYKLEQGTKVINSSNKSKEDTMDALVRRTIRESVLQSLHADTQRMPHLSRAEYLTRFYDGALPDTISEAAVKEVYVGGNDSIDLLLVKGQYVEALDSIRSKAELKLSKAFETYVRCQPTLSPPINLLELDVIPYVPKTKDGDVARAVLQPYQVLLGHLKNVRDMSNMLPQRNQVTRTNLIMDISTRINALNKLMIEGDLVVTDEIMTLLCGNAVHQHTNGKITGVLNMSHGHNCGVLSDDVAAVALPWKSKDSSISSLEIHRNIHLGSNRVITKSCLFTRPDIFNQAELDNKVALLVATPFIPGLMDYHSRLNAVLTEMLEVSADEYNCVEAIRSTNASIEAICNALDELVQEADTKWYTLKMYHIPHIPNTTTSRELLVGHDTLTLTISHQEFEVEDMAAKSKSPTVQYKFIAPKTGKTGKTDVIHGIMDTEVVRITRANEQTAALLPNGVYRITNAGELEFTQDWPDDDELEANYLFLTAESANSSAKAIKRAQVEYGKLHSNFELMRSQMDEMKSQLDDMKQQLKDKEREHQHKDELLQLKRDEHDLNKYVVETDVLDRRFNQHLSLMKLGQASRDLLHKVFSKAEAKGGNLVASSVAQIAGMSTGTSSLLPSLVGPIESYMSSLERQEQIEFFTQLHQVENENIRLLAGWLDSKYDRLENKHHVALEPSPQPEPAQRVSQQNSAPIQPMSYGGGGSGGGPSRRADPVPVTKQTASWAGTAARVGRAVAVGAAVVATGLYLGLSSIVVGGAALAAGILSYI
jgi:hypothetical protein